MIPSLPNHRIPADIIDIGLLLNRYHSEKGDYPRDKGLKDLNLYLVQVPETFPNTRSVVAVNEYSIINIKNNIYKFRDMTFSYTYISSQDFPRIEILER